MGKVRMRMKKSGAKSGTGNVKGSDNQLKSTVGKISADIGAISLGPPRAKILKKTSAQQSSSNNLSTNFASRFSELNKQKKKVTFCQNLISKELDGGKSSAAEDAKHYFKVIHPSAIEKRKSSGHHFLISEKTEAESSAARNSIIPPEDELMSTSATALRKIIKQNVKSKKIRLKARKATFKKKMELLKETKEELVKAKQRQETVIVGDLHPMLESLPSVEESTAETELVPTLQNATKNIPKKTKFSVKKTQKAILDSLKFFEASGVGVTAGLSAN